VSRLPYWKIPATTLNEVDAQERMYVLREEYDKMFKQVQGLQNLMDAIQDERLSMLKGHPGLMLGSRPNA
jgi:hypothetical protein